MTEKGTKMLKLIFAVIVVASSFLYVFVTPCGENVYSMLKINSNYNAKPYIYQGKTETVSNKEANDYTVLDKYVGTITAYGPDCSGCSGTTASGYKVVNKENVITTYKDFTYGEVRILAADQIGFPFGTIVRITGSRIDNYILGIVLDTGGAMRNEWAKGNVLMDLLFKSEKGKDVYDFGRQKNVTFEVLRYGY